MPMAVAETACGNGRGTTAGATGGASPARTSAPPDVAWFAVPAIRLAIWAIWGACMGLPMLAGAQIVADPNAGAHRPGVVQTANGLQQVNITRPSTAGVSTNHYTQFDVNKGGAILNNSPGLVATQQAGYINGNPNLLPGGSARIIVNQVNSTSPSQLRGYLEVAGQRAEVIVANPNGLLVDGAGFINTSRVTLTTGLPVYGGSGSLDAFRVSGGQIRVEGVGLNAAGIDQVDLISRAVKVNAALYANRLNVVAGANRVDYHSLDATAIAGTGASPSAGIDVSQLGGMYANKILLASTEAGVGVSLRGVMAAQAGDLTLTSQGKLIMAGDTSATGTLAATARDGVDHSGTTYAGKRLAIDTQGALTNDGTLAAGADLSAHAASIASTGTLAAGTKPDGTIGQPGSIELDASGALQASKVLAGGDASLRGASVDLAGSQTSANGALKVAATQGDVNLRRAKVLAGTTLDLQATADIDNSAGRIDAGGAVSMTATSVRNDGGTLATGGNAAITANRAVSNTGGKMAAADLHIAAQTIDNANGQIEAEGVTLRTTGDLSNAGGTITQFGTRDASISAGGVLDNRNGTLTANGANATVSGQSVLNGGGRIAHAGAGTLTVDADDTIDNTAGTLAGNGNLSLAADHMTNASGAKLAASGNLALAVRSGVDNRGGTVYGGKHLKLEQAAARLDNRGGMLLGGTDLSLKVADLNNLGGTIRANQDIGIGGAVAGSGEMTAGRNLSLDVAGDYLNDATNKLGANGDLKLSASGTLTNAGKLAAGQTLTVQGANIVNAAGASLNGAATHVDAIDTIRNAGRIEGNTVHATSAVFDNTGAVIGNDVQVTAQRIANTGSAAIMAATRSLKLYASEAVTNTDGATLYSLGHLQIARDGARGADGMLVNQTTSLVNSSATIEADGDIDIAAREVVNKRTRIVTEAGTPAQTARKTLTTWTAGLDGGAASYKSYTFPGWEWHQINAPISEAMLIALRTPVTIEVPKGDVSAVEAAGQRLTFARAPTETWEIAPATHVCNDNDCTDTKAVVGERTFGKVQYYQSLEDTGTTYRITFWPDWDPAKHIRPDDVRIRHDLADNGVDYNEISRTTVTTTATDRLVSATAAGVMQARGTIRINADGGSILNHASTMTAGGNLIRRATGGSVQDEGIALQQTVHATETSTFYWHEKSGSRSDQKDVAYPATPQAPTTIQTLPALATANGAVQTTAHDVTIAAVDGVGNPVAINGAQTGAASGQTGRPQTLGTQGGGIPGLHLPTSGLYTFRTAPGDTYLVTTDSRFTDYGKFLSSDYMLGALGLNPQTTQKRLGDGFYEQKLIRDQITQLTGKTFLAGHSDQMTAYQALMDNGATYARAFSLTPGVGLTEDQMRQLTTDMVWMVAQDVTLPDGTTQSVLVPKVYLAQGNGVDLNSTGALVAGHAVSVNATGTVNNSGAIVGDLATQVLGTDIVNRGNVGGTRGTTLVSASQDVRNEGGRIGGKDVVVSAGRDVVNDTRTVTASHSVGNSSASSTAVASAGTIAATGSASVLAGRDIHIAGGAVDAGEHALLAAGRDLNLGTTALGTTQDYAARGAQSYSHDKTTTNLGTSVNAGKNVVAVAGRDATITGSTVTAGENVSVIAARDITVTAALDTHTHSEGSLGGKKHQYKQSSYDENASGSFVQAGRNATLAAGQAGTAAAALQSVGISPAADTAGGKGDLSVLGSSVSTGDKAGKGGTAQLIASGDITVGAVNETHTSDSWSQSRKSGFLSKSETTRESSAQQNVAVGSVVSADTVAGSAGGNLTIGGSTVAATHDLTLEAGRDLTITTAQNTSASHSFERSKSSGLGATGGGISYGMRDKKDTVHDSAVTHTGSLVGSTDGNVSLKAGSTLRVTGSEVIAAKDLTGVGADVVIEAARGTEHHDETHEVKQTGFTLGVSGGAIGSAINAGQKVASATQSQDGRASALWGLAAGRDAYDAAAGAGEALDSLAAGKGPAGTAVTLSFGTSQSKQTLTQDSTTHTRSNVQAGGTATFIATGVDADGQKTAGNLDIVGSDVAATKVALAARGDVNIVSATDTNESHSTNKSSSGSIGVSYGTAGFGVSASASKSKGNADSTGTTQVNSHVTGSESVSIVSGKDTNVLGGVVSGGKVSADVGGNLNLTSRQDTEESHARQQSMGGGLSFSQGGGVSGSFSASKGKADASYANVTEQSGIRAGDGGFDLDVKGNTDLNGAVIASTATADKNRLSTGTLSWNDIENKSDYSATSLGVSGGFSFGPKVEDKKTGQTSGKNTGGVSPMIPQHQSGSQRGVAQSGVSAGTITITDTASQKQDVATLNRDTTNTNTTVSKGLDLANVLGKQADMMAAAQAAGEAVARTVGDIADSKRKDADKALKKAQDALTKDPSEANRAAIAEAQAAVEGWDEGGQYRAALHAAGGAMIAGLGGGNAIAGAVGAGLSSVAAKQLATLGKSVADGVDSGNKNLDEAIGNLAANFAAGGLGAAVGGGSGAATAANVDRFNRQLHRHEKEVIAEKANGDKAKEKRLTDAACYRVQCWAEYSPNSPEHAAAYVSDAQAAKLGQELKWVDSLTAQDGKFEYTRAQRFGDGLLSEAHSVKRGAEEFVRKFGRDVKNFPDDLANHSPKEQPPTNPDPLTDVNNRGNGDPQRPAVVTGPLVAMTPNGIPVLVGPGVTVPGSPGTQLPGNAIASSDGTDTGGQKSNANDANGFDPSNLEGKLNGYLLDPSHAQNQTKANWFSQALGFDKNNWRDLAKQLYFDPTTAVLTKTTQYGKTYEQTIPINGVNGKIIDTTFVFMKDNSGKVRLVTGIPARR